MKNTNVQARRVIPAIRRKVAAAGKNKAVTLGELIAAAYDVAQDVGGVARILGSRELRAAVGRRIVVV